LKLMCFAHMPRYFFHIHNDADTFDEEGTVYADTEAACRSAKREAQYLASVSVKEHGHLVLDHYVRVTDEFGDVVTTVTFENAVEIRREGG